MQSKELQACKAHFPTFRFRCELPEDTVVIGRYSVLPFYKELEADLRSKGGRLANTYAQHRYVADMFNWYTDFEDLTFQTWFRVEDIPEEGPFVLKGITNSMKWSWDTHMFAPDKRTAISTYLRLSEDSLLKDQQIVVRKFHKLETYDIGPRGLPITCEFRCFVCDGKLLSAGYYWAALKEPPYPSVDEIPKDFLKDVLRRCEKVPLCVVDVARDEQGKWWVVELNDLQMSGLSNNDPDVVYAGLKERYPYACVLYRDVFEEE